ncbi:MAG TPA: hypothetical protein VL069_04810 [Opitutus sp.]|nr:hypothetical protein [Opitutus sp.]
MKFNQPRTRTAAVRAMAVIAMAALSLGVLGFWLLQRDGPRLNRERVLRDQLVALDEKMKAADQRIETIAAQIPPVQERVAQSEKIIRQLEELQTTWNLVAGNRAQQRANAERLRNLRTTNETAVAKLADLQQQVAQAKWERESHEIERTRVHSTLRIEDARKAGAGYRVERAWMRVRPWLCFGGALYLIGFLLLPIAREQWRRSDHGAVVGGRER